MARTPGWRLHPPDEPVQAGSPRAAVRRAQLGHHRGPLVFVVSIALQQAERVKQ